MAKPTEAAVSYKSPRVAETGGVKRKPIFIREKIVLNQKFKLFDKMYLHVPIFLAYLCKVKTAFYINYI